MESTNYESLHHRHTAGSRPLIEYFNDLPDMSSRQAGGGKCTNLYACPVCSQDVAGQLAGLIFSCRQSNLPALSIQGVGFGQAPDFFFDFQLRGRVIGIF